MLFDFQPCFAFDKDNALTKLTLTQCYVNIGYITSIISSVYSVELL